MVSSEQIKRKFVDCKKGGSNKLLSCGCIQTKIITLGSVMWIQDTELMCKKHRLEHKKEFDKQNNLRVVADSSKKNKRKRSRKKDDDEAES